MKTNEINHSINRRPSITHHLVTSCLTPNSSSTDLSKIKSLLTSSNTQSPISSSSSFSPTSSQFPHRHTKAKSPSEIKDTHISTAHNSHNHDTVNNANMAREKFSESSIITLYTALKSSLDQDVYCENKKFQISESVDSALSDNSINGGSHYKYASYVHSNQKIRDNKLIIGEVEEGNNRVNDYDEISLKTNKVNECYKYFNKRNSDFKEEIPTSTCHILDLLNNDNNSNYKNIYSNPNDIYNLAINPVNESCCKKDVNNNIVDGCMLENRKYGVNKNYFCNYTTNNHVIKEEVVNGRENNGKYWENEVSEECTVSNGQEFRGFSAKKDNPYNSTYLKNLQYFYNNELYQDQYNYYLNRHNFPYEKNTLPFYSNYSLPSDHGYQLLCTSSHHLYPYTYYSPSSQTYSFPPTSSSHIFSSFHNPVFAYPPGTSLTPEGSLKSCSNVLFAYEAKAPQCGEAALFKPGCDLATSIASIHDLSYRNYLKTNKKDNKKVKMPRKTIWKGHTYADLIAMAILSSPKKQMTLSQVQYMLTDAFRRFRF